jgi:hypothetical protein
MRRRPARTRVRYHSQTSDVHIKVVRSQGRNARRESSFPATRDSTFQRSASEAIPAVRKGRVWDAGTAKIRATAFARIAERA